MAQPTLRLSVSKASSGSVLLVQDRNAAKPYIEPLAAAGYNVVIAPNTKVGLEEAMMGAFDVVLCDVDVPDAVVDMLSIIQAYEPVLPLVLLGEDAPPSSSHSIANLNLLDRMPKPIAVADVLNIVEIAMDLKRSSKPGIDLRTGAKDVTPFTTRVTAPALQTPARVTPQPLAAATTPAMPAQKATPAPQAAVTTPAMPASFPANLATTPAMASPAIAAALAATLAPPMSGIPSSTGKSTVPSKKVVVSRKGEPVGEGIAPSMRAPVTKRASGAPSDTAATVIMPPISMPGSKAPSVPPVETPRSPLPSPLPSSGIRTQPTTRQPTLIAFKPEESEREIDDVLAGLRVELDPVFDTNALRVIGYEVRPVIDRAALAELTVAKGPKVDDLYRRRVRELAASRFVEATRAQMKLFLDVGPTDILDSDLYAPESALSQIADRVVLQLRSGAAFSLDDIGARMSVLRFQGFQLAVADLDGGSSRLSLIGDLAPEYLKIDASLVRDIHAMPAKRRVVEGLMTMCRLLGTTPIAEGVAEIEERSMLVAIGCTLVQGPLQTPDLGSAVAKPRWSRARHGSDELRLARAGSR